MLNQERNTKRIIGQDFLKDFTGDTSLNDEHGHTTILEPEKWAVVERKDYDQIIAQQGYYNVLPLEEQSILNPLSYPDDELLHRQHTISARMGIVRMNRAIFLNLDYHTRQLFSSNFFPTFLTVDPSFQYNGDIVSFHGYSIHFDQVAEGEQLPMYDFVLNRVGLDAPMYLDRVEKIVPGKLSAE